MQYFFNLSGKRHYFVCRFFTTADGIHYRSSDTLNFFLPFLRRADNTFLPLAVDILLRNPCLFALFLRDGWNVLFIFTRILELQRYTFF